LKATAPIFKRTREVQIGYLPEETRKKVEKWKDRILFYCENGKWFLLCWWALDYGKKRLKFSEPINPTDNQSPDLKVPCFLMKE